MTPFFEALILGILYGLGPCTIFCAPILIPLIMAVSKSGKEGIIQVFSFGFGRISTYLFLGGLAGFSGYLLRDIIFQKVISIFIIFLGIFLLLRYFFSGKSLNAACPSFLAKGRQLSFLTGLVIGLNPCPPFLALLGLATLEKSFFTGAGMGLTFGLGSLVTPLIIFGFLAGKLAVLREFKTVVPIVSALFLIIFGLIKFFLINKSI